MTRFTCLNCGKTGESIQGNKQFCDRQCWGQHYRKSGAMPRADIQLCLHNSGIECSGGDCYICGWHPDVAAARKAELVGGQNE